MKVGGGPAWAAGLDHHPVFSRLQVQAGPQAHHEGLGCGIQGQIGQRQQTRDGRDVDDGALAALTHLREKQADQLGDCEQMQNEHLLNARQWHVRKFPVQAEPGVVDKEIHGLRAASAHVGVQALGSVHLG